MRATTILAALAILLLLGAAAWAQNPGQPQGRGSGFCRFIDENGDGFNDLAPDDDGDGIPNGMDPDWHPRGQGRGIREHFRAGPFGYGPMAAQSCFGEEMSGEWADMMRHMGEGNHMMGMGSGGGMMGWGPGTGTGDHEGCDQPGTGWMEHRGDMHGDGMHGGGTGGGMGGGTGGGMGGGTGGGMGGGHH